MAKIYTVAQASAWLGVCVKTVFNRMKVRRVGRRLGREWMLSDADLAVLSEPGQRGNPKLKAARRSTERVDAGWD